MELNDLTRLRGDMEKCFRCSLCKMVPLPVALNPSYTDACPASHHYHFHGYSGSGKQIMALSLIDGRIEADEALAKIVFACTTCGYCDVACKFMMEAERQTVNMTLRAHLVNKGLSPAAHRDAMQKMKKPGAAPAWADGLRLKILPELKAEVLLFAGCLDNNGLTARKLAQLLLHAGVDVGILGQKEPCCGLPAYWMGYHGDFSRIASENAALLDSAGAATVVTVSGSCLGAIRSKYPEFARAPGVKVLHATEYLDQLIADGRLKFKKPINKKITYHDPCYLGRQSEPFIKSDVEEKITMGCMTYTDPPRKINRGVNGVFEPPRRILKALAGSNFKEMHRIREYSFCCGAGGGVPAAYPDFAKATAMQRIAEARSVGAEYMVTACAHCENHFSSSQNEMPVLDIVDLVYEAAGIE